VTAFSVPSYTLVQGLVIGLNYGLLALGLVLIYRTSRVLNFAHGQLGVVSAVLLSKLVHDFHIPYGPSLVFCLALAVVVGGASELLLRRLFARPRLLVMVATIGLSQVLFLLTLLPFVAPKKLFVAYPLPFHWSATIGTYRLQSGEILTLVVAPLVAIALAAFFGLSSQGLAMRAMAENAESARLSGVWVRRTSTLAWMLAGLLSAVTAVLAAPGKGSAFTQALAPGFLLRALAAALIGGMVSLPIAFVAGVAIGVVQQVVSFNYPAASALESVMFAILLVALVIRVRGLRVNAREEERSSWRLAGDAVDAVRTEARRLVGRAGVTATLLVLLVLPAVLSQGKAFLFARIFVYAVIALSLTVLTGWGGQLSLGQFALVAVGAILTARIGSHVPVYLLLPLSGVVTAVVAMLVGIPALRIRGLYLAVSTLGFALFMQIAVLGTTTWRVPGFGWHLPLGLPDPASTLVSRPRLLQSDRSFYYLALAVLVVFVAVMRVWRDRGLARAIVAVRDNETAAAAMGIRVVRTKLLAFALSGFMAGCAGVCFALVTERFSVPTFDASQSFLVVSMVIIGGLGSIPGALLGAAYLIGIPAVFGSGQTVQFITSGVGLLVFILYLPGGLAGVLSSLGDAVTRGVQELTRPRGEPVLE
jgi:ABC-type branched-subunit amino acid transport system permease subunit